jgi:hypothetical protein
MPPIKPPLFISPPLRTLERSLPRDPGKNQTLLLQNIDLIPLVIKGKHTGNY